MRQHQRHGPRQTQLQSNALPLDARTGFHPIPSEEIQRGSSSSKRSREQVLQMVAASCWALPKSASATPSGNAALPKSLPAGLPGLQLRSPAQDSTSALGARAPQPPRIAWSKAASAAVPKSLAAVQSSDFQEMDTWGPADWPEAPPQVPKAEADWQEAPPQAPKAEAAPPGFDEDVDPPSEKVQSLIASWWQRLGGGDSRSRREVLLQQFQDERKAIKAEIAREELLAEKRDKEDEARFRAEKAARRHAHIGQIVGVDVAAALRDVRVLGSCGSPAALAEAFAELLSCLRRALAICRDLARKEHALETEWGAAMRVRQESCRQRRVALVRQLAEARRRTDSTLSLECSEEQSGTCDEVGDLQSDGDVGPSRIAAAGGVAVVAEVAAEAEAAGVCVQEVARQLMRISSLRGLPSELAKVGQAARGLRDLFEHAGLNRKLPSIQGASHHVMMLTSESMSARSRSRSRSPPPKKVF
eukprot:TRINITY_DN41118_c0_g1_i1.p1 TRINITY_DN41118_c0_g1~~TRINITY_DN41118_c0_g1_i1.p1  ORF type:complete len:474 (+),score=98.47 TRINITY_DN41118_c0_g1_i1:12-1433(+)